MVTLTLSHTLYRYVKVEVLYLTANFKFRFPLGNICYDFVCVCVCENLKAVEYLQLNFIRKCGKCAFLLINRQFYVKFIILFWFIFLQMPTCFALATIWRRQWYNISFCYAADDVRHKMSESSGICKIVNKNKTMHWN